MCVCVLFMNCFVILFLRGVDWLELLSSQISTCQVIYMLTIIFFLFFHPSNSSDLAYLWLRGVSSCNQDAVYKKGGGGRCHDIPLFSLAAALFMFGCTFSMHACMFIYIYNVCSCAEKGTHSSATLSIGTNGSY